MIESCLDSDPDKRPTGRELVSLLSQIASNDAHSGYSQRVRLPHFPCGPVAMHSHQQQQAMRLAAVCAGTSRLDAAGWKPAPHGLEEGSTQRKMIAQSQDDSMELDPPHACAWRLASLVFPDDHMMATRAVAGVTHGIAVDLYRGLVGQLKVERILHLINRALTTKLTTPRHLATRPSTKNPPHEHVGPCSRWRPCAWTACARARC